MNDFRIFCELLAKMMLESIDFTEVLEVYRRNEQPEKLGIATIMPESSPRQISPVEKKSPRNWALQYITADIQAIMTIVEMKSPK